MQISALLLTVALLAAGTAPAGAQVPAPAAADPDRAPARLIDAFLGPVPAAEPDAARAEEAARIIRGFCAERFEDREAASAAAARLSPAALTQLRRAAADRDMEVAERAGQAIAAIEKAWRDALAAELARAGPPARELLKARIAEEQRAWARKALEAPAAEREGRETDVARLKAEMAAASSRIEALKTLEDRLGAPPPAGGG
ncbi:MAG TPA: hypothetical protein PK280_16575 [Planctomycetota bacterium]|nr:hypothetical protein [Planctomycetota bacterium]